MTRQDIIAYCLTFPFAYEDYPFGRISAHGDTAVMRHRGNQKSFALLLWHDGQCYLNCKCDPIEAALLRQAYAGVIPGWHMNKRHWNTVLLGADVPDDEIRRQIANSYRLIQPKINTPRSAHTARR